MTRTLPVLAIAAAICAASSPVLAAGHHRASLAACEAHQRALHPAANPGPRPPATIPWTTGSGQVIALPNTVEVQRWEDAARTRNVGAELAVDHYCHGMDNGIGGGIGHTVIVQTDDALIPVTVY